MAKKQDQEVEAHVYSWQQADDIGDIRQDFDAIASSDELCNLRALPDLPQSSGV